MGKQILPLVLERVGLRRSTTLPINYKQIVLFVYFASFAAVINPLIFSCPDGGACHTAGEVRPWLVRGFFDARKVDFCRPD